MKINILYCIEYLAHGGTEKQLMALINGLDRKKITPHLCCLRDSAIGKSRIDDADELFNKIECKKIKLDYISLSNFKSFIHLQRLIKFVKKCNIEIIQTFFQDPALLGSIAGKLCRIKYIIACFRDMAFWYKKNWILGDRMKIVYRMHTHYIANSEAVRRKYSELFDIPVCKTEVIYNGINIENKYKLFKQNIYPKEGITVGIIANVNRKVKRVDIFLKAASYVLMHGKKDVNFIIIGEGELKEELLLLSTQLAITDSVEFVGRVKKVEPYFSIIDIGVSTSDSEGFSNAILEFMAAGIPVIATNVGGNPEIIKNGINGYLVSPGNYKLIGKKIIQLSAKDELYLKIQRNAIQTVHNRFTINNYISNYEKYYDELLKIRN